MVDMFNFSPLDFLIFFLFLLINWLLSGPFPKSYKEVNNTLVLHSWILSINTQALRVAKECPFLQQRFHCSLSSLISNPSMTFIYSQVRIFSSVGNRKIFIAFQQLIAWTQQSQVQKERNFALMKRKGTSKILADIKLWKEGR